MQGIITSPSLVPVLASDLVRICSTEILHQVKNGKIKLPLQSPFNPQRHKNNLISVRYLGLKQETPYIYLSEIFSFPSLIKLHRISILLFIPINKPKQIINNKSNATVASTAMELSINIIPRRLGVNKPPINKTEIMRRDAVPMIYAR